MAWQLLQLASTKSRPRSTSDPPHADDGAKVKIRKAAFSSDIFTRADVPHGFKGETSLRVSDDAHCKSPFGKRLLILPCATPEVLPTGRERRVGNACDESYAGRLILSRRISESEAAFADRLGRDLEALIEREGPETVAAFIGEPVMAAGGVIVPPSGYWPKIQEICRKYDILLVADEVVCGFGRTGSMFGSTTLGIEPDIVLSKQQSSSYQPLAAVLISDKVYQGIAGQSAALGTFGHGFTASGHPVATAVALENIRLIEERSLVKHAGRMGERLLAGLSRYADHPLVGEVRGVGFIAAIELVADKSTKARFEPFGSAGAYLNARCQAHGMIVRNVRDSIAFCPPLIDWIIRCRGARRPQGVDNSPSSALRVESGAWAALRACGTGVV